MLLKLKNWLFENDACQEQEISVVQATAVLLFEAATADYELDEKEELQLKAALQQGTDITTQQAEELFTWAKQYCLQSTSLYPFTRVLNDQLSNNEKVVVLESLWCVAYADGQIDKYEEHYLRHVADLLHLPHSQYIAAKLSAEKRVLN